MALRCELMEHGLSFELDVLYDCCILHHENLGMPVIKKQYNGENLDWKTIFRIKKEHYLQQIKKTLPECEGCFYLSENEVTDYEEYISWIMFNQSKLCNSNCIYCGDNLSYNLEFYDTLPIIKELIENKYFKKGGLVIFQGGEPTLMKNFDVLLKLFVENDAEIKINTSGIKYSEEVCNAMLKGNTLVCISLDSPNKDIYKKIKLTDKFDAVVENIKKYAACQNEKSVLKIKYILIPGINDSVENIDEFFELVKKLGIKNIVADMELQYLNKNGAKNVSPHILFLFEYMKRKSKEENMGFEVFSFAQHVLKDCVANVNEQIFSDKKLLTETVNSLREQNISKNVSYQKCL